VATVILIPVLWIEYSGLERAKASARGIGGSAKTYMGEVAER
jgi:hypothetical protein